MLNVTPLVPRSQEDKGLELVWGGLWLQWNRAIYNPYSISKWSYWWADMEYPKNCRPKSSIQQLRENPPICRYGETDAGENKTNSYQPLTTSTRYSSFALPQACSTVWLWCCDPDGSRQNIAKWSWPRCEDELSDIDEPAWPCAY